MSTRTPVILSGLAITLLASGCGPHQQQGTMVDMATCSSGLMWTSGDKASDHMYPGRDCNECHIDRSEGPVFAGAGTVYEDMHVADDCYGVAGVSVDLVGADGVSVRLTTNEAGNFWLPRKQARPALPYTAQINGAGRSSPMSDAHNDFNCASCHTAEGWDGADGRLVLP
jgi:hypothetical protein